MDPDYIFIQHQESSIQYRSAGATNRIISKSLGEKGNSYTMNLDIGSKPTENATNPLFSLENELKLIEIRE